MSADPTKLNSQLATIDVKDLIPGVELPSDLHAPTRSFS
jgi:hypothetical protein